MKYYHDSVSLCPTDHIPHCPKIIIAVSSVRRLREVLTSGWSPPPSPPTRRRSPFISIDSVIFYFSHFTPLKSVIEYSKSLLGWLSGILVPKSDHPSLWSPASSSFRWWSFHRFKSAWSSSFPSWSIHLLFLFIVLLFYLCHPVVSTRPIRPILIRSSVFPPRMEGAQACWKGMRIEVWGTIMIPWSEWRDRVGYTNSREDDDRDRMKMNDSDPESYRREILAKSQREEETRLLSD